MKFIPENGSCAMNYISTFLFQHNKKIYKICRSKHNLIIMHFYDIRNVWNHKGNIALIISCKKLKSNLTNEHRQQRYRKK